MPGTVNTERRERIAACCDKLSAPGLQRKTSGSPATSCISADASGSSVGGAAEAGAHGDWQR